MTPRRVRLPDKRVWLRVADSAWKDPLDTSYARKRGGRWNPPDSHATLYLNGDVTTARVQIEHMLAGFPVSVDDLDDDAYLLVAVTLPRTQTGADAATHDGLKSLGLPDTYPNFPNGRPVAHEVCQPIGRRLWEKRFRGVWCRSARMPEGRELAWFPATARSTATPVWPDPLPLSQWRHATTWPELGLKDQPEPVPDARSNV